MRKTSLLLLIAASVLLIAVGAFQLLGGQKAATPNAPAVSAPLGPVAADGVQRITVQDLHTLLQKPNPPLVWELRGADAFALEHLPGSRLVQLGQIEALAKTLDKQQAIVTLCT